MTMKTGDKYVTLTIIIVEEEGGCSARCHELGTASCGDTVEEALDNIREAIGLHLDTLEELGERQRVFRERGIRLQTYRKPKSVRPVQRPVYPGAFTTTERIPVSP